MKKLGYLYQHEETGRITVIDEWQIEHGWENHNERWFKVGAVYLEEPLKAMDTDPKET
jgi:hypothetical protein